MGVGEQFVIGSTCFEVGEESADSGPERLRRRSRRLGSSRGTSTVKFSDAETRIEILAALPGVIRDGSERGRAAVAGPRGPSGRGPRAESAAVVRVDLGEHERGADDRGTCASGAGMKGSSH